MSGTIASLGAYDQCIDTTVEDERSRYKGKILFHGKHCMVDIKPPLPSKKRFYKLIDIPDEFKIFADRKSVLREIAKFASTLDFLPLRLGLCVPSGCSLQDIDQLGKLIAKYIHFDVSATRCEVKRENEFSALVIFIICAFCLPLVLTLIGSLLDLYSSYKKYVLKNILLRALLAFSAFANFKKFKDTKVSDDNLKCLNGIRFITMSWIILAHSYFILDFYFFNNLASINEYISDFFFQAIINATVAVDTFFCIGGLLLTYLTLKHVKEGRKSLNVKLYIFHRLWRILPAYTYCVGFVFLLDLMGSGPFWHDVTYKVIKDCYSNWWTNLLFINNFYDPQNMCAMHGWFIACDVQLYMAALIILIPLLRWPKIGLGITGISIIASMIFSAVWAYVNNYPPTLLAAHPDPMQRLELLAHSFFRPFVHVGPYCIGMLAGYLLATRPKLHIPKPFLIAGWCLAIATNMSVLYGVFEWNKGRDPTFWETMLYTCFNKTAWATGIAWVIVCCATGHGGVINHFLSSKIFIPLARLTFVAYLLHPYVQFTVIGNLRGQITVQQFVIVYLFLGHLCVTYAVSFFASLLIEAPFLHLEKIILHKEQKPPVAFRTHSNSTNSLKISKFGDISSVLPFDGTISDISDKKSCTYKL